MRAVRLPNGKLPIPVEADERDAGPDLAQTAPHHPD
jgi:hypothetical protein